jgi:lipoprotein-anchoring transpeptidase ErfK/SrfK
VLPRRSLSILVALAVAGLSGGSLNATAATKTTKKQSAATPKKTATTKPPTRNPNNDLVGWDSLSDTEWPKALDAFRAHSINSSIRVHQKPDNVSPAFTMNKGTSAYGPVAFLALGRSGEYVRVLLPLRPNGSIGWVRASDVTLDRMEYRVVVNESLNTLTVEGPDGVVVSAKVGMGTNNTPTPTGLFYVKEIVPQSNPNGGLGPIALGLSGLSEELRNYSGGYGRVAIHGTNAPGKLGGDVSHGCIRMDNPTILRLAKLLPIGTPVEIIADASSVIPESSRRTSSWIAPTTTAAGASSTTLPTTSIAGSTTPAATTTVPGAVPVSATVPPTTIGG